MSSTPKCCHAAAICLITGPPQDSVRRRRSDRPARPRPDRPVLAFHAYPLEVPLGFQLLPNVIGLIRNGDAQALPVASSKRMTALPDIPTAAEAGLQDYESSVWLALLASQHQKGRDRQALCSDAGSDQRSEGARPLRRAGRRAARPRPARPKGFYSVGDF
jgi:hypothetical protein